MAGAAEVLTFMVGGERLALPAADIAGIIRPRAVTRVPNGPPSLLGVANLRGSVLPVVSLARLLGRDEAPPSDASRIVVVDRGSVVGLLVDSVFALSHDPGQKQLDFGSLLSREFNGLSKSAPTTHSISSQPVSAAQPLRGSLPLLGFMLDGQEFALPLEVVTEVARLPANVAAMPLTDPAMTGAMAFRGGLISVVAARALLGMPAGGFDRDRARMVVTRLGTAMVGLVVDCMTAILRVDTAAIDPVPVVLTRGTGEARVEAICRLEGGRRLVSILSPGKLFDDETVARIRAAAGAQATGPQATGPDSGARDGAAAQQVLVFRLGEEHYGLPLAAVEEVARHPGALPRLPRAPAFVEGVMNLRGQALPVIDQRARFGAPGQAPERGRRIVVLRIGGLLAGLAVDAVSEVLDLAPGDISPAPDLGDGARLFDRVAASGPDGRMILLVDPAVLLDRAARDLLAAMAA